MDCITSATLVKVERSSAFALIQTETYSVCDPKTHEISQYKLANLNNEPFTVVVLLLAVTIFLLMWRDEVKRNKTRGRKRAKNIRA